MQKDVLQKLLQPFVNYKEITPPNVGDLMDQAAYSVTDGLYSTWQSLVDFFMSEYDSYTDLDKFLFDKCGIDQFNEDGGSILGEDAGSEIVIPVSPVDEKIPLSNYSTPQQSTFGHVKLNYPATTDSLKINIYKALANWWVEPALDYISKAYGLTVSNDIVIDVFFDASMPTGAFAAIFSETYESGADAGKAFNYRLGLNASTWGGLDLSTLPVGGQKVFYSQTGFNYVIPDNIIVHEMTHAVFASEIRWYNYMPFLISEGCAQVLAGTDDTPQGYEQTFSHDVSNRALVEEVLTTHQHGGITSGAHYHIVSMFMRWLGKKFNKPTNQSNMLTGTPFLNKLIYGIILYDKFYTVVSTIIDLAIQYATKLTSIKITYIQFIHEYVSKMDILSIDQSLFDIANIDFTNQDCGAYGGLDSKFVDYVIKRHDRFRILNIYNYLNQVDTLYYSFSYYAKYEKNEYKVRDLIIRFTEITPSTINNIYKKSIISRLVRGIFKPVLQCLEYYLNLRFDSFNFCKIIHIDFDDDPTPIRPCSYQVGFDTSGKVNSMLITFYTYAYIPIDDRDTMPALGYYTGNYLLYIFCIFIILSKLNNAQAFYRHPIIVAIAITLVGYDELGETDIKDTAVNGNTEQYAVGGIIGD